MNASEFMSHYWYIAIAASAVFVFLFQAFMRLPQVAYEMDEFKIRFKPIRRLMRTIYTARFARTLSSLYSSGMPVLLCLQVGKTTVGNRFISAQFEDVIIAVRRGGTLADAVGKIDGFVQKLTSTIFVGEETGNLEHMLNVISASLDYESEISLSKMTTMVEPIMLIIMAVIIGFVMLAVMMPIFQMYGSIQ
jgi:type IV pilus assembly protein PilC